MKVKSESEVALFIMSIQMSALSSIYQNRSVNKSDILVQETDFFCFFGFFCFCFFRNRHLNNKDNTVITDHNKYSEGNKQSALTENCKSGFHL